MKTLKRKLVMVVELKLNVCSKTLMRIRRDHKLRGVNIRKLQLILEKCFLVRREECSEVATKTRRVEVTNWYQLPQLDLISALKNECV